MRRPVAIDLFSGCGGMSLGLEAAGFDIAVSVEFDPVHALVHHLNFPYGETICKDMSKIDSATLLNSLKKNGFSSEVDLIAGGPPCQGFSQMGKRQLDDPRNSLVFDYLRVINDIRPKYFIFENVPGIAAGEHKKFLDELVTNFEEMGYRLAKPIKVLDASLFGGPQKRKRLILIGSRADVPAAVYPTPTHTDKPHANESLFSNHLAPLNTVSDAIGDLAKYPAFVDQVDMGIESTNLDYSGFRYSYALKSQGFFSLCHTRIVAPMVYGHIGSKHTDKSIERFTQTGQGAVEKTSRFFKLHPDGLCNTLRAGTASDKGAYTAARPIHYSEPRCITVREAARLHTFPDWFQFHNTIWHGFREIGNAVMPLFAKSIGDQIVNCLGVNQSKLPRYELPEVNKDFLSFNMGQASKYWDVPSDTIAKRKRLNSNAA